MRLAPQPPSRENLELQGFRKQCKHVEREQESKKLAVLIEKVKRQLAARQGAVGPRVA
jgi:hypothetical protein